MQWTTTGDRITLPYVAPEDDLQSTPATIKALAEAVVAELELATPVGAISPYMGDVAPDGWLICDGSEYDPADLPELYAVNSAFHADDAPGEFRVPDLRGRMPYGAATFDIAAAAPARGGTLGQRRGDWRLVDHQHKVGMAAAGTSTEPKSPHFLSWEGGTAYSMAIPGQFDGKWYPDGSPGIDGRTDGKSTDAPHTVVNFIVYAGRPTTGISPLSELAPMTTRMMIEARLAQAGIGEEEVKMLKEQLEELKRTEAK